MNTIQTGTLSSHSEERQGLTRNMDQTTALYSRKFLQLAKFALPPSFGETAQTTRETNLPLLPRRAGERSAFSVSEFIAAEGQSEAGLGCLCELHPEWNVPCAKASELHHPSCGNEPETQTHCKCLQQALLLPECLVP